MIITIIMVVVLISMGLITGGLYLIHQERVPRGPVGRLSGSGLESAPVFSSPALPEQLWQRPFFVAMPLTNGYAVLYMLIGLFGILNFICSLGLSISLEIFPGPCNFLFLVGGAVMFYLGLRKWQRIQALATRGQTTQGVVFDRWITGAKGRQYCVAYYLQLLQKSHTRQFG
jgi:hypothetical protein